MSTAPVIQLASSNGPQDKVIRGVPQLTIWKAAHTRYTNFSTDWQEVTFNSTVQWGGKSQATFVRYGDLIDGIVIETTLPPIQGFAEVDASDVARPVIGAYWANAMGFAQFKEVELEIGGTSIDVLTPENMWTYDELFNEQGRKLGKLIGKFDWSATVEDDMIEFAAKARKLYTILPFYNYVYGEKSLSIPMVALTRHEIKLKVQWNDLEDLAMTVYKVAADDTEYVLSDNMAVNSDTSSELLRTDLESRVLVSYVYISDAERDAFTEQELQYLIVENQNHTESVTEGKTRDTFALTLSHPVTFHTFKFRPLDWNTSAGRRRYSVGFKDRFDYTIKLASSDADLPYDDTQYPFTTVQLKFNNHTRWPQDVDPNFYHELMPQHHARCKFTTMEFLWSYAIKVYEYNPTSTANYSKIDNMTQSFEYIDDIPACDFLLQVANYNQIIIRRGLLGKRFHD